VRTRSLPCFALTRGLYQRGVTLCFLYLTVFFSLFLSLSHTVTTAFYTLSLHDALPICRRGRRNPINAMQLLSQEEAGHSGWQVADRKSTRLNSSHVKISYAVFCLKKKMRPRNK